MKTPDRSSNFDFTISTCPSRVNREAYTEAVWVKQLFVTPGAVSSSAYAGVQASAPRPPSHAKRASPSCALGGGVPPGKRCHGSAAGGAAGDSARRWARPFVLRGRRCAPPTPGRTLSPRPDPQEAVGGRVWDGRDTGRKRRRAEPGGAGASACQPLPH